MESDLVYRLHSKNYEKEKNDIIVNVIKSNQKPAIIFTPHEETVEYQVKKLKELGFSAVAYTSKTGWRDRVNIIKQFKLGKIKFLLATPTMYYKEPFKGFVDEQTECRKLSGIVFDVEKHIYKYCKKFVELKKIAREQRWILISDDVVRSPALKLRLREPKLFKVVYVNDDNNNNVANHEFVESL